MLAPFGPFGKSMAPTRRTSSSLGLPTDMRTSPTWLFHRQAIGMSEVYMRCPSQERADTAIGQRAEGVSKRSQGRELTTLRAHLGEDELAAEASKTRKMLPRSECSTIVIRVRKLHITTACLRAVRATATSDEHSSGQVGQWKVSPEPFRTNRIRAIDHNTTTMRKASTISPASFTNSERPGLAG